MEEKIKLIEKRMDWLRIEIIHDGYLDGYTHEGFKKELIKLEEKLKELKLTQ